MATRKPTGSKTYGYYGRKFFLSIIGMAAVGAGLFMCQRFEISAEFYKWLVFGVVGIVGGFSLINGGISIASMVGKNGNK